MKHFILASASVLALAAGPAYAQSTTVADKEAAPLSDVVENEDGLAEIIVTAQRIQESAQKTPVAIAVIQPADLIRQNVTRSEDLSRVVPALVATASGGPNTSFFLRGVGNTTVNSYSDPAIAFNYDGVYIGRPNATQGFFYDLQRVEVLKGPQGTLYGRNATGGAINVLPKRPALGQTGGEVQASYGNYDAFQGQAALNLALGDQAALRVAGAFSKRDGYLSDGTSDQDSVSVRGQLLVELTPSLTTRIGVDYSHQGGAGTGSYVYGTFALNTTTSLFNFTPTPQFGPEIGVHDPLTEAFVQTRFITQAGRNSEAVNSYPSQDNAVWGVTNETNWTTDIGTLTVQAAYRHAAVDSLSTTSNFRGFKIDEQSEQITLEARFAGKIGDFADYLVGGFLFGEDIDNLSAINQLTVLPIQNYKTGTDSRAVFGRLAAHVTDTITLTAAGRYTDDKKYMNGLSNVFTFNCGNPFAPPQDLCPTGRLMPLVFTAADVRAFYTNLGVPVGTNGVNPPPVLNTPRVLNTQIAINSTLETEKFTYRLAADWELTPSNLIYAGFETGFHGGGFNFGRGLETYQPESIKAFTVGSKNRFFNNRVQLNVEGFYWKYKDQQISQFGTDFSTPPISVFYTSNIGRSTIKGIDVDFDALVTKSTRVTASVQYLKTKYESFIFFAGRPNIPNVNCPYTAFSATQWRLDCSGKPALYSPKWSFNLGIEQTIDLDGFDLIAQAGTRWRGDFFAATSYQPWVISRAAYQSDASLTLTPDSEKWFATAFVNNIEDTRRLSQSTVNGSLSTQTGISGPPRTYGLRLGGKF